MCLMCFKRTVLSGTVHSLCPAHGSLELVALVALIRPGPWEPEVERPAQVRISVSPMLLVSVYLRII